MNAIVWIRFNLRVNDNLCFTDSITHPNCYPVFFSSAYTYIGSAGKVWLHHALESFSLQLSGKLSFFHSPPKMILPELMAKYNCSTLYLDRSHEPRIEKEDIDLMNLLSEKGFSVVFINQRTLWDHKYILKENKTPYKVFTPFYKNGCLHQTAPDKPVKKAKLHTLRSMSESLSLADLKLLPRLSWHSNLVKEWDISEEGAQKQWKLFLEKGLKGYKEGRNFPIKEHISKLSPYLHFGQISIRQLYYETLHHGNTSDEYHFLSELGWREFSYYLLHHFPSIETENFQSKFNNFPWKFNDHYYKAWCNGQTGYPIIDAGMRELYQTGYMHNRTRMICGSFLVKNLLIHWKYGEKWFKDCLFDADQASNIASWQWVAGTGADAAPYFRIFNPILQAKKFDPEGVYIKKYIPELSQLPIKYLYEPWEFETELLSYYNVKLGTTYPKPIINFKVSRDIALQAFETIKNNSIKKEV